MKGPRTISDLLGEHPFFVGISAPTVRLIEGCSKNVHWPAGSYLFREGDPADSLYVLRRGRVALEVHAPGRPDHVLDTVEAGDVVGGSWLVPPYRWFFDARASEEVSAVEIDGRCLRDKCDADPAVGYALMQRVVQVMYHRLQTARVRLLDLYGDPV
jgi:CRP/FNR family transcriptional regulator, cyclic AMP receptor protein